MASSLALATLTACGGGGSSDPSAPVTAPVPVATAPITGSAAVGAAVSGGVVNAKCASGSASTTTATDGTFSLSTTGLTFPCMLEVTFGTPAQKLHSFASAAGRTNITPVTELVTALAFGNSALPSLYAAVTSDQLKLAAAALSGANQQALAALSAQSLTLPAGFDPIGGPLSPATGQSAGDLHDQLLDRLQSNLGSNGQTLQTWVSSRVVPAPAVTGNYAGTWNASYNGGAFSFLITQAGNNLTLNNITQGLPSGQTSTGVLTGNTAVVTQNDFAASTSSTLTIINATTINAVQNSCTAKPGYVCLVANGVTLTFNKVSSTTTPITTPITTPTSTSPVPTTCAASNLTTAAFNAIQLGMTVAQVNQTIGCAYAPSSTQRTMNEVVYAWTPPMSAAMILVFFDASGTTVTGIGGLNIFKQSMGF